MASSIWSYIPWDAGITKWIGHHFKLSIIAKDHKGQGTKSCLIPSPFVWCPWLPLGTAQVDEELAELREWTGLLHGQEYSAGGLDRLVSPKLREVYLKVCSMWFLEAGWQYKYTFGLEEIVQLLNRQGFQMCPGLGWEWSTNTQTLGHLGRDQIFH